MPLMAWTENSESGQVSNGAEEAIDGTGREEFALIVVAESIFEI